MIETHIIEEWRNIEIAKLEKQRISEIKKREFEYQRHREIKK